MKPLLEVSDVCLSYHSISGETRVLSHISFSLFPGEFLAVVGPSGCGKSTLLNLICGLLKPEQGQILLNGENAMMKMDRTSDLTFALTPGDNLLCYEAADGRSNMDVRLYYTPEYLGV